MSVEAKLLNALSTHDPVERVAKLREAVREWLASDNNENHWMYGLDWEYTPENISFDALGESDLGTVQSLQQISTELDVDVFLTFVEVDKHGTVDGSDYESEVAEDEDEDDTSQEEEEEATQHCMTYDGDIEINYTLQTLLDLEGRELASDISARHPVFLPCDYLDNIDFEETDYDKPDFRYDHRPPTATHWYRFAAVVLVRRDSVGRFLVSTLIPDDRDVDRIIHYFLKQAWRNELNETAGMTPFKQLFSELSAEVHVDDEIISRVLKLAVERGEWAFYGWFKANMRFSHDPSFLDWFAAHMGESDLPAPDEMVYGLPSLWERLAAIHAVYDDLAPAHVLGLDAWSRKTLSAALDKADGLLLVEQDGQALMQSELCDADFRMNEIVPFVRSNALANVPFSLAFLREVAECIPPGSLQWASAADVYRNISSLLSSEVDWRSCQSFQSRNRNSLDSRPKISGLDPEAQGRALKPGALASFAQSLVTWQFEDISKVLNNQLSKQASIIPLAEFHDLWLPFVHKLCGMGLATSTYLLACRAVLYSYIRNYVEREPNEPTDFQRSSLPCDCTICTPVNSFLVGAAKVARFPLKAEPRVHVERTLRSANIDCTSRTEGRGSPRVLVITKTCSKTQKAQAEWRERAEIAKKKLAEFPQNELRVLLGEQYSIQINFEHLKVATRLAAMTRISEMCDAAAASRSAGVLAPISANTSSPTPGQVQVGSSVSGKKRKISDVIDLTGDN